MIALAAVCRLNDWLLGSLIVFGHMALEPVDFAPGEFGYVLWTLLHDPGDLGRIGGLTVSLSYRS